MRPAPNLVASFYKLLDKCGVGIRPGVDEIMLQREPDQAGLRLPYVGSEGFEEVAVGGGDAERERTGDTRLLQELCANPRDIECHG